MQSSGRMDELSTPGAAFRSNQIEDAADQAALQPWVQMECFQLSRGRRLGTLQSLDLGDLRVVRETQETSVQKLGATPVNLCTLSFCSLDPAFRFSEHEADSEDTIFFMAQTSEFDIFVPAGAQTTYVTLDEAAFLRAARVLNPKDWEDQPHGIRRLKAREKSSFKDAVDIWLRTADLAEKHGRDLDRQLLARLLFENLLQIATARQDASAEVSRAVRVHALRICRHARAFCEERLGEDELPTVSDICEAVGVSERSLYYAFRTYAGMPPAAYLRLMRLNRARAFLAAADPGQTSVTSVAMRFGFLHLGRFAQDYKRVFDVSPSVTLSSRMA